MVKAQGTIEAKRVNKGKTGKNEDKNEDKNGA